MISQSSFPGIPDINSKPLNNNPYSFLKSFIPIFFLCFLIEEFLSTLYMLTTIGFTPVVLFRGLAWIWTLIAFCFYISSRVKKARLQITSREKNMIENEIRILQGVVERMDHQELAKRGILVEIKKEKIVN